MEVQPLHELTLHIVLRVDEDTLLGDLALEYKCGFLVECLPNL